MYVLSVNLVTKDGEIPAGEIVEGLDAKTIKRLEETESIREPTEAEIALYEKVKASKAKESEAEGEDGGEAKKPAKTAGRNGKKNEDLA